MSIWGRGEGEGACTSVSRSVLQYCPNPQTDRGTRILASTGVMYMVLCKTCPISSLQQFKVVILQIRNLSFWEIKKLAHMTQSLSGHTGTPKQEFIKIVLLKTPMTLVCLAGSLSVFSWSTPKPELPVSQSRMFQGPSFPLRGVGDLPWASVPGA